MNNHFRVRTRLSGFLNDGEDRRRIHFGVGYLTPPEFESNVSLSVARAR